MLSRYAKNGRFCDVVDVFEAMPEKNIMSHNAMLSLYLGIGDFRSARQVFDEKGHGIDVYLMNEIKNITREYFHQPLVEKNKIKLSAETGYRGYQKIGENITKEIPDILEAIGCYREVKHGMYGDLGAVMQGSNKCDVLASCVTHLFAWNQINLSGAHTDYGLLTLLNQDDDIVVFQVLLCSLSNLFSSVIVLDGYNVDVSCIWSEIYLETYVGLLEVTLHRVINNSPIYCVCVAYFYK
ncbi:putative 2-oxoglutarate-dependent dioxygenase, partial [Capsicum chinense]